MCKGSEGAHGAVCLRTAKVAKTARITETQAQRDWEGQAGAISREAFEDTVVFFLKIT